MSDPNTPTPAPPPPPVFPPPPPKDRGLGWFFAISGSIVLILTLGCILAVTEGNLTGEMSGVAILCGSPTLILGAIDGFGTGFRPVEVISNTPSSLMAPNRFFTARTTRCEWWRSPSK